MCSGVQDYVVFRNGEDKRRKKCNYINYKNMRGGDDTFMLKHSVVYITGAKSNIDIW